MALSRINSQSIADGTVIASDIADGTVTNTKLAGSITSDKITSVSNTAISGLIQAAQIGSANASVINAGTLAGARLPAGSVLQVVQTVKSDTFSTSTGGASPVDVTGLSLTITPTSASNKVLVSFSINLSGSDSSTHGVQLLRDSTPLALGDGAGSRPRMTVSGGLTYTPTSQWNAQVLTFQFLDSPATTSATTYKLRLVGNGSATTFVNRTGRDSNTTNDDNRFSSQILAMEIAA